MNTSKKTSRKRTAQRRCAVADGSAFRRGQRVAVAFTDGADDENWTGIGWFVRLVRKGEGWDNCLAIEPHCLVKTAKDDRGSCFPTRCVKPNTLDQTRGGQRSD
jgi:hypothetical protein